MSIFDFYIDRAEKFSVSGKADELIVPTRKGRGTSVSAVNNDRSALMQDNTSYSNGDLCTEVSTGNTYFIVAQQSSTDATNCILKRTNATIDILRITKHYTGTTQDYLYEVPVATSIPCFYEDVNAKIAMYDAGLLATSTRRFLVSLNPSVKLLDRIRFNGEPMQIDGINSSSYQGLLWIQCSKDSRVTKVVP